MFEFEKHYGFNDLTNNHVLLQFTLTLSSIYHTVIISDYKFHKNK